MSDFEYRSNRSVTINTKKVEYISPNEPFKIKFKQDFGGPDRIKSMEIAFVMHKFFPMDFDTISYETPGTTGPILGMDAYNYSSGAVEYDLSNLFELAGRKSLVPIFYRVHMVVQERSQSTDPNDNDYIIVDDAKVALVTSDIHCVIFKPTAGCVEYMKTYNKGLTYSFPSFKELEDEVDRLNLQSKSKGTVKVPLVDTQSPVAGAKKIKTKNGIKAFLTEVPDDSKFDQYRMYLVSYTLDDSISKLSDSDYDVNVRWKDNSTNWCLINKASAFVGHKSVYRYKTYRTITEYYSTGIVRVYGTSTGNGPEAEYAYHYNDPTSRYKIRDIYRIAYYYQFDRRDTKYKYESTSATSWKYQNRTVSVGATTYYFNQYPSGPAAYTAIIFKSMGGHEVPSYASFHGTSRLIYLRYYGAFLSNAGYCYIYYDTSRFTPINLTVSGYSDVIYGIPKPRFYYTEPYYYYTGNSIDLGGYTGIPAHFKPSAQKVNIMYYHSFFSQPITIGYSKKLTPLIGISNRYMFGLYNAREAYAIGYELEYTMHYMMNYQSSYQIDAGFLISYCTTTSYSTIVHRYTITSALVNMPASYRINYSTYYENVYKQVAYNYQASVQYNYRYLSNSYTAYASNTYYQFEREIVDERMQYKYYQQMSEIYNRNL